ncbi:hypothetical protein [Curtobacterium pusillum]|uniref:hypothetical protein n=1 Tax=Curtobacterium pusillum TaxID=69373 RepID=UPI0011A24B3E|nr:hypothetical protein [Curtobacterium pusillum]
MTMAVAMLCSAGAAAVCFVGSGERRILAGIVPCLVMFGAMLAMAMLPATGIVWLLLVPVLLVAAMLAALGRAPSLLMVHRGVSLVAMAGLFVMAAGADRPAAGATGAPAHAHSSGGVGLLHGALVAAVVVLALGSIVQHLREIPDRQLPREHPRHLSRRHRAAHLGEVIFMTAAIVLMPIHG